MKEQKTNKKERQKRTSSFQGVGSNQQKSMKIWIGATIGLVLALILIITLIVLVFKGDINIPGITPFANNTPEVPSNGSFPIQQQIKEHMAKYDNYDYEELYQAQISKPKIGEEIAEIYIQGAGKPIKVRLFENDAPEIVQQFKRLVKEGFYDNKILHGEKDMGIKTLIADERINWTPFATDGPVISDKPEDIEQDLEILKTIESWETFEVKSNKVLPYNGALCAYDIEARDGKYGVNLFLLNVDSKRVVNYASINIPVQLQDLFSKHGNGFNQALNNSSKMGLYGSNPNGNLLDYVHYPTFGQVFEGMDIVEKMSTSYNEYKINKVEIIKYGE